jgi:hypothetical protein
MLAQVRVDGEYIKGMNHHRLLGLDEMTMRQRLKDVWLRQLGVTNLEELRENLRHRIAWPEDHALTDWWGGYWQVQADGVIAVVERFFKGFEAGLAAYCSGIEDVQAHFATQLNAVYREWVDLNDTSFSLLVRTACEAGEQSEPEQFVATVLTLSLLEGRYREHYEAAKAEFSPSQALAKH